MSKNKTLLFMKLKILSASILLVVFGCVQETSILKKSDLLESELKVIDDYVVVSKTESLTPLLQKIAGMSSEELNNWEDERGFVSLRRILNKAIEEETKYFDKLEAVG